MPAAVSYMMRSLTKGEIVRLIRLIAGTPNITGYTEREWRDFAQARKGTN